MFLIGTFLLGSVLFLYTALSLIRPLSLRWWWQLLLCGITGAVAFKYALLYRIFGGHFFRPAVPGWVELGCNWLFISLLLLVFLLLVLDAGRIPVWLCLRKRLPQWRRLNNRLNLGLVLLALGITAHGVYNAFALPEVKEITIPLEQLEKPVRLAMLTDLHADRYKDADFFREVVARTNALQPDAVVITGDFEDGPLRELAPALAPLRQLSSRWGTFAVHGNHDYFSGHTAWQSYLSSLGIRFLNNEHVLPGAGLLVLAGVTDPAAAHNGQHPPHLGRALHGSPGGKPVVLLAHQPRIAADAARHGVALQLSGHTHGGQCPLLYPLLAAFNDGLVKGLYRREKLQVYVSSGTSLWSGFPLRLGIPPEIALIHLVPAHENY